MTDHGFDPQTATLEELVEICERQETKEAIRKRPIYTSDSDNSSVEAPRHKKKKHQKKPKPDKRQDFYCKEHGPNPTHDTVDCKVIKGRKEKNWKDKDKSEPKYSDYRSKYKKKAAELHILQAEAKKEKAKWKKAYTNMKAKEASSDNESEGEIEQVEAIRETVREGLEEDVNEDSSSSSSSSSDSNSE
jgi:hypothetical protein